MILFLIYLILFIIKTCCLSMCSLQDKKYKNDTKICSRLSSIKSPFQWPSNCAKIEKICMKDNVPTLFSPDFTTLEVFRTSSLYPLINKIWLLKFNRLVPFLYLFVPPIKSFIPHHFQLKKPPKNGYRFVVNNKGWGDVQKFWE